MAKALTLTVIANITSNYGESLGNVASVQKVFKKGNTYSTRSRESLKYAIMNQSGMYADLQVTVDGATQKMVSEELNAVTCRALEGGYMNTKVGEDGRTCIRNSSIYLTDAISCEPFVLENRFHNNLNLASKYAEANDKNVQNDAKKVGLMPYNYEYDKSMKTYSLTIDLTKIGTDENFPEQKTTTEEKRNRVLSIIDAIENLNLIVKGNLDNAEPLFIVGGLSDRMTHQFENVVNVNGGRLTLTQDLKDKIAKGYKVALLEGENFENELDIINELKPVSMTKFFDELKDEINNHSFDFEV